jgi:CheY-like chemotaxis protein
MEVFFNPSLTKLIMTYVLVIDNDPTDTKVTEFKLKRMLDSLKVDATISSARNVKQGLEMVTDHQPDLVVMETELGNGRGYNLVEDVKERCSKAYVVGMSDEPRYRSYWEDKKADGFFTKFEVDQVLRTWHDR